MKQEKIKRKMYFAGKEGRGRAARSGTCSAFQQLGRTRRWRWWSCRHVEWRRWCSAPGPSRPARGFSGNGKEQSNAAARAA